MAVRSGRRRVGLIAGAGAGALAVAGRVARRRRLRRPPRPLGPYDHLGGGEPWRPGPARYGVGIRHNVGVTMSDGVVLRADIHYPTDKETGEAAPGPFPVLLSITPYGKKAPPPAAQIGGGATPYLIRRGYIEVMVDVRGTGASDGVFEMFGERQRQDVAELVRWAAKLPGASGAVGMFGISYLAITQLFTAGAVGPDSPLKAIFPVMAAHDFYRDAAGMGGVAHLPIVRAYGGIYSLLNVLNPLLEAVSPGGHPRPRSGGLAGVRERGRNQRRYFGDLVKAAAKDGDPLYDGDFWATMQPARILEKIVENGVAVFLVGGWHDAFQRGAPLNYVGLQNAWAGRPVEAPMLPDQETTGRFRLLMGPWYHVSDFEGVHLNALQLRFFDQWLKGEDTGLDDASAPLTLYALGADRWIHTRSYPLPQATPTRLHLTRGSAAGAGLLTPDAQDPSTTRLRYTPRGPIAGRSVEQWTLGMYGFISSSQGRKIRYDQDNRRIQRRGALTYTTEPFTEAKLIAGPITLTLQAAATTTETLWVCHLDDVAPDGTSRPLTQGALLGSRRALDATRTWYDAEGAVLRPFHTFRKEDVRPVVPGETTRYDIEIFPTTALIAEGHRVRITIATADFPHLTPTRQARRALAGGVYTIHEGSSYLLLPLASP